jgi:hypothetical protein
VLVGIGPEDECHDRLRCGELDETVLYKLYGRARPGRRTPPERSGVEPTCPRRGREAAGRVAPTGYSEAPCPGWTGVSWRPSSPAGSSAPSPGCSSSSLCQPGRAPGRGQRLWPTSMVGVCSRRLTRLGGGAWACFADPVAGPGVLGGADVRERDRLECLETRLWQQKQPRHEHERGGQGRHADRG